MHVQGIPGSPVMCLFPNRATQFTPSVRQFICKITKNPTLLPVDFKPCDSVTD